mmetsp:Transcript_20203/g.24493  ORF Transcript_20203/g.24493 Transcript_20203/m.24493 type:complete len:202 (-) Transcript_20203:109-714(-)
MMRRNSSSLISPSPSLSASSIISCNSSSDMFSPSSFATRFRFLNVIFPVSSSSKSLNAFSISSLESFSPIFAVIISRNSVKSIVPLPSLSISEIIFLISSFLGSNPKALIATFSSLASIVPEPSVSKRSKASLISCRCSSVRPASLFFLFLREAILLFIIFFFSTRLDVYRTGICIIYENNLAETVKIYNNLNRVLFPISI